MAFQLGRRAHVSESKDLPIHTTALFGASRVEGGREIVAYVLATVGAKLSTRVLGV